MGDAISNRLHPRPRGHPGFDRLSGVEIGETVHPRVSRSSITQGFRVRPMYELSQSKPHEMGVPVPRRFHPEVPEESHSYGRVASGYARGSIDAGLAQRSRLGRVHPRPSVEHLPKGICWSTTSKHVVVNSAETLGGTRQVDRDISDWEERRFTLPGSSRVGRSNFVGPEHFCGPRLHLCPQRGTR